MNIVYDYNYDQMFEVEINIRIHFPGSYTGIDGLKRISKEKQKIYDWCKENCTYKWASLGPYFRFKDISDAILFKLTWG